MIEVDPFEVKLLADYGAVPANIFGTVRYTIRVYQRRKKLRELEKQQQGFFERARRRVQEKYAAIVEQVRDGASEQDEELQSVLAPIQEATQLIGDRAAQLEATREQFEAQVAKLEGELSSRGDDRKEIEADRNRAQIVLEDCLQKQARCQANLRRVRSQLGAAHDAAAAAAGENAEFAPPEHARQIAELEGQKASLTEQLRAHDGAVADARRTVGVHDKALRELGRRVGNIHDRRRALDQQASEARDLRVEGLRAAEQTRLDAFERTLRLLLDDHAQLFDDQTREAVEQLDQELGKARYECEKHSQAINAYDEDAYKKGVVIMVVVAVGLLLALFAIARVG